MSTPNSAQPIRYWNRARGREEVEQVYGARWLEFLYGTPAGQRVADSSAFGKLLSRAYGYWQSTPMSKRKISEFITRFRIPMEEYEPGIFLSFNDFFIRRFREGARPFAEDASVVPAPAEARYFAWENADQHTLLPIKGLRLSPAELLGDAEKAKPFSNGPVLLARLCPVDYHRFHYPDAGTTIDDFRVSGMLHSVNPLALAWRKDILVTNERHVSILETRNFGKLAYVEVGALCVGRIVQTHPAGVPFERGDEKGYFLFGGSTVVLLGEPGRWKPDADLLSRSAQGLETLIRLGEPLGAKP